MLAPLYLYILGKAHDRLRRNASAIRRRYNALHNSSRGEQLFSASADTICVRYASGETSEGRNEGGTMKTYLLLVLFAFALTSPVAKAACGPFDPPCGPFSPAPWLPTPQPTLPPLFRR